MRNWMLVLGLLCATSMVVTACSDDEDTDPNEDAGQDAQTNGGDGGEDAGEDGSAPTPVTPAAADDVLITELMASPACGDFEWIEIHNPSDTVWYDLQGCFIADREERVGDPVEHHEITESVVIPPGGYVVLAETDDAVGLGFEPDYNYQAAFGLSGGGENPAIGCGETTDADGGTVPQIISVLDYDDGSGVGDTEGLTVQVDSNNLLLGDTLCTADPSAVYASCTLDGGATSENAGTPGAENRECPIL